MSLREVVGLDLQLALFWEAHTVDRVLGDELGGESARVVACQQYPVRMLVEQPSDGVQVSEGEQPAVVQYDDLLGNALYLLEDVARDQHGLALRAKLADDAHNAGPGDRVTAVQWLVEDDEVGVVD